MDNPLANDKNTLFYFDSDSDWSKLFDYDFDTAPISEKNNLEFDLLNTDWLSKKVIESDSYAQNLYAALCNNIFQKIGEESPWSCSWRYAGGIIARIRKKGDYLDWYCSGIFVPFSEEELNQSSQENPNTNLNYVAESIVTEEIKTDLQQLGWTIL